MTVVLGIMLNGTKNNGEMLNGQWKKIHGRRFQQRNRVGYYAVIVQTILQSDYCCKNDRNCNMNSINSSKQ